MISLLSHLVNSGSPLGAFIYFIYILQMSLLKLQKLAKLNEDLKEFNPDYQYTKHLIENNIRMVSKWGQEVNQEKEFNIIHTEKELESRKKAKLLNSRWLSDGSLECEFLSTEWEVFTKLYWEDDIFARRQQEREEKIKEQEFFQGEAVRKFGHLFLIKSHQNKKEKFAALI